MFVFLEIVAILLVAVAMGLALAHALEFPGKLRLDEQTYLAVQTIYYPGFTIGGISEPLAVIATLVLLIVTPKNRAQFWLVLTSFVAMLATQAVFWLVTQPTNRFWLKHERLSEAGAKFFAIQKTQTSSERDRSNEEWTHLRDKWEHSHVIRAVLAGIALIAIVIAAVKR